MRIVSLSEVPEMLPIVSRWHHDEWEDYNPGLSFEARLNDMQEHLTEAFLPSTFVAVMNGAAIASAAILKTSDMETHPEWSPWLASVFVSPKYRRQGIATALCRHIVTEARKNGLERVYLFTPDQAILYEKLGWQVFVLEEYMGHQVSVMQLELN